MSAHTLSAPSRVLGSLGMNAYDRRVSSPDPAALSSPESSAASVGFIDMSDLMLPASALESELFGVPQDSNATVVSSASYDEIPPAVVATTSPAAPTITTLAPGKSKKRKASSAGAERRHSLPTLLMLDELSHGEDVTQPVPEFLCHLFSMLRDPSYAALIAWSVPASDEPDHAGGGRRGQGKIVVHQPEALQDRVLGNYYRHSKYASFQRQLNYFGFKKRLHGGKKGKLSPCSYIHDLLTEDAGSLFRLKRRPPSRKRAAEDVTGESCKDCATSVASHDDAAQPNKKCRVTVEKKLKKGKRNWRKKDKDKKKKQCGGKPQATVSVPNQFQADEPGLPSAQSSAAIESHSIDVPTSTTTGVVTPSRPLDQPLDQPLGQPQPPVTPSQPHTSSSASQPTLLELLSTSLPPSEILFNDAVDVNSMDAEGIPAWVTADGKYHYHNVDSSLIDLAMLY